MQSFKTYTKEIHAIAKSRGIRITVSTVVKISMNRIYLIS